MRHTLLFAAFLATIPVAACHSSVAGPGTTGGAGSTSTTGNGAGGTGEGGSCIGTTPPSKCSETLPCPSGTMCMQEMDLTTCGVYGDSCEPLPAACSAMPTCDCIMNDTTDYSISSCSGDAMQGFVVDQGFGDSSCCP
jgi:hypothetical protein